MSHKPNVYEGKTSDFEEIASFRSIETNGSSGRRRPKRPSFTESANEFAKSGSVHKLLVELSDNEERHRQFYQSIDKLISNPICCGYLRLFCLSQYNSENLDFILAVDEFRDMFFEENDIWNEISWRDIDDQLSGTGGDNVKFNWTSSADLTHVNKVLKQISDRYLLAHSETQICNSESCIQRTLKRMENVHLYGPEVFEEACIDPIKTMRKDILPRFLVSDVHKRMISDLASCDPPPAAGSLTVPPPLNKLLSQTPIAELSEDRMYTLDEVIECMLLYNEFLTYLRSMVCSENLICVRIVDTFIEESEKENCSGTCQIALTIYKYFVAAKSAYEVSLSHFNRKKIMLGLASPDKELFNPVRRSAYDQLKVHFVNFTKTSGYASLGKLMNEAKRDLDREMTTSSSFTCLGLTLPNKSISIFRK